MRYFHFNLRILWKIQFWELNALKYQKRMVTCMKKQYLLLPQWVPNPRNLVLRISVTRVGLMQWCSYFAVPIDFGRRLFPNLILHPVDVTFAEIFVFQ